MRNYEAVVDGLIGMMPEGVMIQPESREIAIMGLEEHDALHGESSKHPKTYHGVDHPIDSTGREIILNNLLFHFVPPQYKGTLYDKTLIRQPSHDIVQGLKLPEANESASADWAIARIEETDNPVLNQDAFKTSIRLGALATYMKEQDGNFIQDNLRQGEPDPSILHGAWADVGAIPMEGIKRYKRDTLDLAYEWYDNPSAQDIINCFLMQPRFYKSVVDDKFVIPNIEYYYSDHTDEVYEVLKKEFHSNIVSTYKVMMSVHDRPELASTIRASAHLLDRLHMGSIVGKVIAKAAKI